MAYFYLPKLTFEDKIDSLRVEIEDNYKIVQEAVERSKQNLLNKLNKILEMQKNETNDTLPLTTDYQMKCLFDESILEQLHKCCDIEFVKKQRAQINSETASSSSDKELVVSPSLCKSKSESFFSKDDDELKLEADPLLVKLTNANNQTNAIIPKAQIKRTYDPIVYGISKGNKDMNLEEPKGIAICSITQNIFIADAGNECIKEYTMDGEFVKKFGDDDCKPFGITVMENFIYVTSFGIKYNFYVFNTEGQTVRKEEIPVLNKPTGIAVNHDRTIYICSTGNNYVVCIEKGEKKYSIFAPKYMFKEPRDVKVKNDNVIVLDYDNPSLHFFTTKGVHTQSIVAKFLQIITPFVHAYIYDPAFFDIKSDGYIYVTDRNRHCIKVYMPDGKFVQRIGKEGRTLGTFIGPEGIIARQDDKLVTICNRRNNMLQIF